METIHRDFADKGVRLFLVYKTLAHPEQYGYVRPFSLQERLNHIQEAKRTLGTTIPWLCDALDNRFKHAMGDANNSEFVIGPDGKILHMRDWSNPQLLRNELTALVGPVDEPTQVADLNLKTPQRKAVAASGVVPRIKLPTQMRPIQVQPQDSGQPFYVKLRAEVDPRVLTSGTGALYLGFHLDPLYQVHWNNLVAPVEFKIEAAGKTKVTPAAGKGPQVKTEADVDPREFLVQLDNASADQPLEVTVRYFACNDEQGWCKEITQRYVIRIEGDRDAGRRSAGGGRGAGFRGGSRPRPGDFNR